MLKLPTILIVDDSATTRAMIKRIIQMTELAVKEILEAEDGLVALELMKTVRVQIVLADLNMPVMGGVEMIERMRKDSRLRDIAVLIISAQPDEELTDRLKASGIAGYLPKPFTPEGVRDLVGPLVKALPSETDGDGNQIIVAAGLLASLSEALETMAFITPGLPEENEVLQPSSASARIRVGFHGRGNVGTLTLVAPPEFGVAVASNCGNEASNAGEDALKELANITCGLFLRRLEDGARGFELAPPIVDMANDSGDVKVSAGAVTLTIEGYRVLANVTTSIPLRLAEEVLS
jgi:two-component system, chemotaxis family, chemotaxis protein CheY